MGRVDKKTTEFHVWIADYILPLFCMHFPISLQAYDDIYDDTEFLVK